MLTSLFALYTLAILALLMGYEKTATVILITAIPWTSYILWVHATTKLMICW